MVKSLSTPWSSPLSTPWFSALSSTPWSSALSTPIRESWLPHGPVPGLRHCPVPWLPHGPVPWLPHGSIPCPPLVQSLYSLSALKTFSSVVLLFLVDKEGNKEDNRFYLAGITRLRGEHFTTPPPVHVLNTRAEKCYGGCT